MKAAHGYRRNGDRVTAGGRKRDKRQRKRKRDAFSVMERQKIIKQNHERDVNQTSTAAEERERESERETSGKTRNPAVSQSERKRERRVKRKYIQSQKRWTLVLQKVKKTTEKKDKETRKEAFGFQRGEALKRKRENGHWKDKRERRSKQIV